MGPSASGGTKSRNLEGGRRGKTTDSSRRGNQKVLKVIKIRAVVN